jgi:hypothetical protein
MKHIDLAKDYFERHSTSNECHITSDKRVFHTSGYAISFSQEHDLQDQTIESYTRAQVEQKEELTFTAEIDSEIEEEEKPKEETDLSGFASPAGQIALDVFLANNDVEKIEYKDLKALVKHLEIETADQKADTLKLALIEYKNNLAQ